MSLKIQIEQDLKKAMLAKDHIQLLALRAIKSAILIAETDKGASGSLTEDVELQLLMKAVKQRRDSAEIFEKQGRTDLYEKEQKEIEVISRYLPKQMTEEELQIEVKKIIEEVGASDPKEMGRVMGIASKRLAGRTDGKTLSMIVKQILVNS
jgi:uncharacterized protein